MFEQLKQLIQQHAQSSVVNNPDVPNEHNDAVMNEASESIISELKSAMGSGDLSQITNMIQGKSSNTADSVSGNFAANIAQKFGIDAASAQSIAGNLIPGVLGALGSKIQGSGGNLDLQNILGSLTEGGGLQNTVNNIGGKIGLDKDGDGDVDLGDITKMFGK